LSCRNRSSRFLPPRGEGPGRGGGGGTRKFFHGGGNELGGGGWARTGGGSVPGPPAHETAAKKPWRGPRANKLGVPFRGIQNSASGTLPGKQGPPHTILGRIRGGCLRDVLAVGKTKGGQGGGGFFKYTKPPGKGRTICYWGPGCLPGGGHGWGGGGTPPRKRSAMAGPGGFEKRRFLQPRKGPFENNCASGGPASEGGGR